MNPNSEPKEVSDDDWTYRRRVPTVWYLRQQLPYKTDCPQQGCYVSTMSVSEGGHVDPGSGKLRRGTERNPRRVCEWHLRSSQGCCRQRLNRLSASGYWLVETLRAACRPTAALIN